MTTTLVYVESHDGSASPASLELLAGARGLVPAGDLVAVVAGADTGALADACAQADRILEARHPGLAAYAGASHVNVLAAAIAATGAETVLVANTYVGLDLAAAVAERTGRATVAQCVAIRGTESGWQIDSLVFGGKLIATLDAPRPGVLAVNPGAFAAPSAEPGRGERQPLAVTDDMVSAEVRVIETTAATAGDVDITRSERLVCIGRGLGEADRLDAVTALADALGADVAASRPVVDNGWLPKERQVGKSGLKVKPQLYLALGVSGAPEHLEGIAEAELVIAVNTDPDAPIFGVAQYGTTCDLFEVAEALTEALSSGTKAG